MAPDEDTSAYVLSEDASAHIFATRILPAELPPEEEEEEYDDDDDDDEKAEQQQEEAEGPCLPPLALLVVGQTGAGKSFLSRALLPALARRHGGGGDGEGEDEGEASVPRGRRRRRRRRRPRPPAHLVADAFKRYHPAHARLAAEAGPDARRWLAAAARWSRPPAATTATLPASPASSAPPPSASRCSSSPSPPPSAASASCCASSAPPTPTPDPTPPPPPPSDPPRPPPLPPRLTPARVHDKSYRGLVRAAVFLDREPAVADQVLVVRRGNLVAHARGPAAAIAAALVCERTRPLSAAEARDALARLDRLDCLDRARDHAGRVRAMLQPLFPAASPLPPPRPPDLVPLELAAPGRPGNDAPHVLRLGLP